MVQENNSLKHFAEQLLTAGWNLIAGWNFEDKKKLLDNPMLISSAAISCHCFQNHEPKQEKKLIQDR